MAEAHQDQTLEALLKIILGTQEIAACRLTLEIQEAGNHQEMTDEVPQWITEINPGIQEAPLLSRDMVHPVAQGIHVVTVAHQGLQMMGASQDQFIHHNSSGDLTKEDHLQDFLKVLILPQGVLVDRVGMSLHRIKKRLLLSCKF